MEWRTCVRRARSCGACDDAGFSRELVAGQWGLIPWFAKVSYKHPESMAIGSDFNQATVNGLVPLHWASEHGKTGLVRHMIAHGANVADVADVAANGMSILELALNAQDFQALMLLIDQLKAVGVPPPGEFIKVRLVQSFRGSHPDSRNRVLPTLRDWGRMARKNRSCAQARRPVVGCQPERTQWFHAGPANAAGSWPSGVGTTHSSRPPVMPSRASSDWKTLNRLR
jgi:hypothetical protein